MKRSLFAGATLLALAGCASVDIEQAVSGTNAALPAFTAGQLQLHRGTDPQAREAAAAALLAQPLTMDAAVRLALVNSPAVQALIAQRWADLAEAGQSQRIANPIFSFERVRHGDELEIGRLLSIGLLDLLTLPVRVRIAQARSEQVRTQLAIDVVDQVSRVRQAWVRAVAARQNLQYAEQVNRSAQASAELARRMQQVGNFTKLQRARQHAFHADAAAQLASATHAATAAREELVRQLGLSEAQAAQLKLPERLPDLPAEPKAAAQVSAAALQQRLDVRLARQQVETAGKAQGLQWLNTVFDVELGGRHDTVFDNASGTRSNARGWEAEIRLPLFDWGGAQRAAMNAQTLLAANRYEAVTRAAASQLRESYSAYRTAYDIAKHYRDEIVPLRKTISEENVLRYNGMLIGVFELLADQRDQVSAVMDAIRAQEQFWLAHAALASAEAGKPIAFGPTPVSTPARGGEEH